MQVSTQKFSTVWHLIGVCLLAFFPIFYQLGTEAIHIWDEAIYANNAVEMLENGNIWVLYNNGEPSLYNTKPPLAIWLQVLSMKFFGVNEWAVRLPSAFAALGTCLMLFYFLKRWCNASVGYLAVLFLLTSKGFVQNHVALSGDLDALLCFFITA